MNTNDHTHSLFGKITELSAPVDTTTLQIVKFEIVRKVQAECFTEQIKILRKLE